MEIYIPFQLDYDFFIHPASTSTLSKRPAPKRHVPGSGFNPLLNESVPVMKD